MKRLAKYIIIAAIALLSISLDIYAQNLLRYSYMRNGYRYSGTERVRVTNGTTSGMPLEVKLSKVRFKDGSDIYIMRIDYEDATPWKIPVNAPLVINTTSGKTINLKHSSNAPNIVAPEGVNTPEGKKYWNYGEYYLEVNDIKRIAAGVSSIDATKRWSEGGHIKISYKNDEFGSAIFKLFETLENAPVPDSELGSYMKSLQDRKGSRLAETKRIDVNGKLGISMIYLYYAPSNNESYDMYLAVPGKTIPLGRAITVTTSSGNKIELKQEKDMVAGHILCYPSIEQVKEMAKGVSNIYIEAKESSVNIGFQDKAFANAVSKLYNSIQTISVL